MENVLMGLRERMRDYATGDNLRTFWRFFRWRAQAEKKHRLVRHVLTFLLSRMAHRHGGYIGNGAVFDGIPSLPHGLHGIYISRYAHIGADCRIYQNVTIGEVAHQAPQIGSRCLIGAGAVLIGPIHIGSDVKIGAGAVVNTDIPDNCTVVAQPPRIIVKE